MTNEQWIEKGYKSMLDEIKKLGGCPACHAIGFSRWTPETLYRIERKDGHPSYYMNIGITKCCKELKQIPHDHSNQQQVNTPVIW